MNDGGKRRHSFRVTHLFRCFFLRRQNPSGVPPVDGAPVAWRRCCCCPGFDPDNRLLCLPHPATLPGPATLGRVCDLSMCGSLTRPGRHAEHWPRLEQPSVPPHCLPPAWAKMRVGGRGGDGNQDTSQTLELGTV